MVLVDKRAAFESRAENYFSNDNRGRTVDEAPTFVTMRKLKI